MWDSRQDFTASVANETFELTVTDASTYSDVFAISCDSDSHADCATGAGNACLNVNGTRYMARFFLYPWVRGTEVGDDGTYEDEDSCFAADQFVRVPCGSLADETGMPMTIVGSEVAVLGCPAPLRSLKPGQHVLATTPSGNLVWTVVYMTFSATDLMGGKSEVRELQLASGQTLTLTLSHMVMIQPRGSDDSYDIVGPTIPRTMQVPARDVVVGDVLLVFSSESGALSASKVTGIRQTSKEVIWVGTMQDTIIVNDVAASVEVDVRLFGVLPASWMVLPFKGLYLAAPRVSRWLSDIGLLDLPVYLMYLIL